MISINTNNNKMSILSEFTVEELDEVISENSSLRGYLQGYLAEVALKKQLLQIDHVTEVIKIADQSSEKGDFRVIYKNVPITIEVKSIRTGSVRSDILNDTWQGTVGVRNSDTRELDIEGIGLIRSSNLVRGEFDILAISCYAVSNTWDFVFMSNEYLPPKNYQVPELIKTSFVVNPETTPFIQMSLQNILELVYNKKQSNC
jgi:hypothetical protein